MEFQDPKAGEPPLAELTGIQFGILSKEETLKFSVFEDTHTINKAKDFWDNRLGVYNLTGNDDHCGTCGARNASECDGHFGHINLPLAIYHPLHIRYLKNLLSRICLVCHRFKGPKEVKKGTFEDEAIWMEIKRQIENRDSLDESDCEIVVAHQKTEFKIKTSSTQEFTFKSKWTHASGQLDSLPQSLKTISTEMQSKHIAACIDAKGFVLPGPIDISDDDSPSCAATQKTSDKPEHLQQVKISTSSKCAGGLEDELDSSESSDDEEGCKYCGAKLKKRDERYPNLVVKLSKMKDNSYETIEMNAVGKEETIPLDYWSFVQGHAGGCKNIRPLLPFEAFKILKSLSKKVIRKLGMDERLARPESLIMDNLPLPPSGSRITEMDFGSSVPRAHTDRQHMHLRRLAAEIKQFRSSLTGKLNFAGYKDEVMVLQSIASDYLTGSKWEHGVKPKTFNTVKNDVEKEDKLMRGHILAKTNNASARMVVVGDPSIKLEELLLPLFLVEHLTIPEKVTALNINRLQQSVDNGPRANLFRTGAVYLDMPGRGRVRLSSKLRRITLEVGDTVHRHLRNGDLVIVNRPPSLSKHSIMAMQVRLHLGCSLSINPLICASFQADFDGDCMHLFVPQSSEALAEVHGLMSVSDQLINPQGGQSNNALAEDSRLGAYLISSSCLFLDKTEMSQLTSSSLVSLPTPAILKSPKLNEPLWTGQQLYSTVIPKGICYRATDKKFSTDVLKGILIQDGELLVCDGSSSWLGNTPDALTAVISKSQGPAAALVYLNRAQDLANMYLRDRGFSVGLNDFQLTRNRSHLLRRRLEEVARANREALMQTLLADEHVQREELKENPTSKRGLSVGTKCHNSKGLYLGTTGIVKRVEALDKVAIERFQSKFGQTTSRLAQDYCNKVNPLIVMIKAGSKGSMSKLNQQAISLGLQLYKGEHLIPWNAQNLFCQKQLTDVSSLKAVDLLQFEKRSPLVHLPGYWESRGIITSSYLDGLLPLQFFTHTIASRYGMMRAKVEQPNLLLKRLLLFLRDLHVGYDGSVRSLEGQQIVQFEYGGLLEMEEKGGASRPEKNVTDWCEAGEAVGILAATAITEPLYQLKLDSPNMIGAKAIGPLELINETLSSSKVLKVIDRRVLLRMPFALRNRRHGQEKGATRIQQYLKPVTLDMVASTTMIEYRKTQIDVGEGGRESPWVGHIRLNVEKLKAHQVLVGEILKCLENNYSLCTFSSSNKCHFGSSSASQEDQRPCIHFFMGVPSWVATIDDKEYEVFSSSLLETMKGTILTILLSTTIKGDERIESLNILWEEMNWNPRCANNTFSRNSCEHGIGELVVEVTVKENYCKVRGKAWEILKVICLPIMQLLDWQRCMPYSIKEINHVFGLEAAKGVMLQRLELAVEGMGKGVNLEHLELIADSMLTSGEVHGASISGYKDLCKTLFRSTPFSNAAFQNPKNSFILAGRQGSYETIDGALSSSVWGKATSLGTGSNFGIFWQPAKAVEEPLRITQKGVDIHQCITKLNSLLPPEPCKPVSIRDSLTKAQSRTPAEAFRYRTHRLKNSLPHVGDNDRRFTGNSDDQRPQHLSRHAESSVPSAPSKVPSQPATAGTKGILGDGKNIKPSQPKTAGNKGILGDGRNIKSSQPTMTGAKGILGDGRSKNNLDSNKEIKHSHHGHQRSSRRVERAARFAQDSRGRGNATKVRAGGNHGEGMSSVCMDQGSDDEFNRKREQIRERRKLRRVRPSSDDFQGGNHFERVNHASDPVTLPDSVGEAVGSPRADGHEDSSSFHTPNETLDQTHSANCSPCSKFRGDLDPPPLSLDVHASEGDQMSGIGQPPLQTPIDKVVMAESCAIRQPSSRVDPLELPDAVGSGSVSPIAERSRNRGSRHQLNYTVRTERLNASHGDPLELPDAVGSGSVSPIAERSRDRGPRHQLNYTIRTERLIASHEDALERRKEEQKDEWEKLLQLSKAVQYILHRKYGASERLEYKDQKWIMEKLLRYHPDYAHKVGCGVKCIKVDYHENHSDSRCFFVVRLDETVCDFSFRKCIKGYANAKSPALAMQYDHEVLFKYERENCSDVDLPYSPDLYPSPNVHEHPASDLIPPAEPTEGDCNGSIQSGSKIKEESCCETSEPGLQGAQVSS